MTTILQIIGALCILAFLLVVLWSVYETIRERIRVYYWRQGIEHVSISIDNAAWWFSEDKVTQQVIHDIAKHVREYHTVFPETIRQNWRAARKVQP